MSKTLLIVDPQNDFCDPAGALYVPGADIDMNRLAGYIRAHSDEIDRIVISQDWHYPDSIFFPEFWRDREGNAPAPFTAVTLASMADGTFRPKDGYGEWATHYIGQLEYRGKGPLILWPHHCMGGTEGAAIYPVLASAIQEVSKPVTFVRKGINPYTEMYSVFKAEVPAPNDPATELNCTLLEFLEGASGLVIAGEASSHCIRASVEDIVANFSYVNSGKVTLLSDCMSAVRGFETAAEDFKSAMSALGMTVTTA